MIGNSSSGNPRVPPREGIPAERQADGGMTWAEYRARTPSHANGAKRWCSARSDVVRPPPNRAQSSMVRSRGRDGRGPVIPAARGVCEPPSRRCHVRAVRANAILMQSPLMVRPRRLASAAPRARGPNRQANLDGLLRHVGATPTRLPVSPTAGRPSSPQMTVRTEGRTGALTWALTETSVPTGTAKPTPGLDRRARAALAPRSEPSPPCGRASHRPAPHDPTTATMELSS
ncbi:hypothetical protein NBEOAGPD_2141 [Methylobacterium gregans]|jgi:hypothetical protein|uniref:Uncharacterized protein n=1 Tax=Methylobacterium gregans TaxID=374424 RepID=A0AA37HP20_9HYPH|nr:hypothetical protein [Methylobacterium gregans]GJD78921.1 hypothetical protein NBEOAGPD_2141 [Methylobacterium gregans]